MSLIFVPISFRQLYARVWAKRRVWFSTQSETTRVQSICVHCRQTKTNPSLWALSLAVMITQSNSRWLVIDASIWLVIYRLIIRIGETRLRCAMNPMWVNISLSFLYIFYLFGSLTTLWQIRGSLRDSLPSREEICRLWSTLSLEESEETMVNYLTNNDV